VSDADDAAAAAWDDYVYSNQETEIKELQDKIKNLTEAGNELRDCASRIGTVASGEASVIRRTQEAVEKWNKVNEPREETPRTPAR
jgi:phosphopantetheine adenylyltransferase